MGTRQTGFQVIPCGCVINRYGQGLDRSETAYVEEKGPDCLWPRHQANEPVAVETLFPEEQSLRPTA